MGYVNFHTHRPLPVNSSFYTLWPARLKTSGLVPDMSFLVIISVLHGRNLHHRLQLVLPLSQQGPIWLRKKSSPGATPCFPFFRLVSSNNLFPFPEPEALFFPRPTPSSYLHLFWHTCSSSPLLTFSSIRSSYSPGPLSCPPTKSRTCGLTASSMCSSCPLNLLKSAI